MLDLCNCSCLSSRCVSILVFIINQSSSTASQFSSFSPHGLLCSFSPSFHSSIPPCHPAYTSVPVNMGSEKGPKVTLWQALVYWHHSHPSGTLIWFQRPFAFHLWLSKVINLPCFPRQCWLTTGSQPRKRKEQQRKWAAAFWFEQMIWAENVQYVRCTLRCMVRNFVSCMANV